MNRIIFLILFLILPAFVLNIFLTGTVYAQRCLPGLRGIQLTTGTVDGVRPCYANGKTGCCLGVNLINYTAGARKWVFGGEFLTKGYPYKAHRIAVSQFTVEGGYFLPVLSDRSKVFFLSAGFSALAGYETCNRGQKRLPDGATLLNGDAFIYGGAATLEAEAFLSDRIVLLVRVRERAIWGNTSGRFHLQGGAGLRLMIN
jgi:hypothetical protein